ncbi:uncharacterized protein LOC119736421 [Patiria miniata]|uniref:Ig-like domain-containing protein n=1 Tax=Patiria miniata TaxID=46514 RepID=A0A914ARU3_PATMI|nr:uncharacterized protein LOC119736421 [Patiria miniata]
MTSGRMSHRPDGNCWFLRIDSNVSHYTPNCADKVAPFSDLLQKDVPSLWEEDHQASFTTLKHSISTQSWLRFSDTQRFKLQGYNFDDVYKPGAMMVIADAPGRLPNPSKLDNETFKNIKSGTIFLERGNPGIVSCPPVASGRIPLDQIEAMFWYFPRVRPTNLLIFYFKGNVAPQNGIPEGVYDINKDVALVIENVTDSDEGTYYCKVAPKMKMIVDGHMDMRVKVSPKKPFPEVTQCTTCISESECKVQLPNDIKKPRLTCIVRDTKPAVALRWLLEYSDGDTQFISDKFTVHPSEYSVNTFTTSASIPIITSNVDTMYRCQANGEALSARSDSYVTVTVTTARRTPQTPHVTSLKPTITSMEATFSEDHTVKDTPDGSQNTPIWFIVVVCLLLTAIVGLGIVVCKVNWSILPIT